ARPTTGRRGGEGLGTVEDDPPHPVPDLEDQRIGHRASPSIGTYWASASKLREAAPRRQARSRPSPTQAGSLNALRALSCRKRWRVSAGSSSASTSGSTRSHCSSG